MIVLRGWLLSLLVAGAAWAGPPLPAGYVPREGDVLFQRLPANPLSDAIETATQSPYTHCGMVVETPNGFAVIEAIGPVREIAIEGWIGQGRGAGFAVYRLKPAYQPRIGEIVAAARRYLGRPYDIRYRFDDERIYCSELIYKAFRDATGERLGEVRALGELDWRPVEPIIREIENGGLPLEREMITPRHLSEAEQLEFVLEHNLPATTGARPN